MQLQLSKENFHQTLNRFSTSELETLVEKFPYFQQAHLLLAKKYQQEKNPHFDEQLQMAALYTQDRDLLFAIFNEAAVSFPILKPETFKPAEEIILAETEVVQEIVKPEIPLQVAEELKNDVQVQQEEKQVEDSEPVIANEEIIESESVVDEEVKPELPAQAVEEINNETTSAQLEEIKTTFPVEDKVEPLISTEVISPIEVVISEEPIITVKAAVETDPQTIEEVEDEVIEQTTEAETAVEEKEEAFNTNEPHTFAEWLQAFSQPDIPKLQFTQEELPVEPEKLDEELNKMILQSAVTNLHELVEESTNYSKGLNEFISEQIQKHKPVQTKVATNENEMPDEIATETLAKLYEAQKKYQKAIRVYEVLRLKYPKKNDFFAARINHLKNIS